MDLLAPPMSGLTRTASSHSGKQLFSLQKVFVILTSHQCHLLLVSILIYIWSPVCDGRGGKEVVHRNREESLVDSNEPLEYSQVFKVSNENLTWICPACKSIVTTWSAPAAESKSATSLTVSMVVKVVVMVVANGNDDDTDSNHTWPWLESSACQPCLHGQRDSWGWPLWSRLRRFW